MSHTPGLEAAVQVENLAVALHVRSGRLHVDGPFAGNIEVVILSDPTLPPKMLLEALAVQTSLDLEPVTAIAYESFPDGRLEITFHSPMAAGAGVRGAPPDSLTVVWTPAPVRVLGQLPLQAVRE